MEHDDRWTGSVVLIAAYDSSPQSALTSAGIAAPLPARELASTAPARRASHDPASASRQRRRPWRHASPARPVAVWDGDGPIGAARGRGSVWPVSPHVRSTRPAGGVIPARESSGRAARDHLVALLGGARGTLRTGHVAVRGRAFPACRTALRRVIGPAPSAVRPSIGDLSCAMVRDGYALAWKRYGGDRLCRSAGRAPSGARAVRAPDPDGSGPFPSTAHPYGGRDPTQPREPRPVLLRASPSLPAPALVSGVPLRP